MRISDIERREVALKAAREEEGVLRQGMLLPAGSDALPEPLPEGNRGMPAYLFEAERVTVGEALGLCQNPAKNERGELAAAEVERARRALRAYVFGTGVPERTGNSLRAGEGEGDGRR